MSQNDYRNRRSDDPYGGQQDGGYGFDNNRDQRGGSYDRGFARDQDRNFERGYQPGNSAYEQRPQGWDTGRRDFDRDFERGDFRQSYGTRGYGRESGGDTGNLDAANWGARQGQRTWDPYSSPQGGQQSRQHHDPDYLNWRDEQIRNLDSDYDSWRQERYSKFSDDFNKWRSERATQSSQANKQDAGKGTGNTGSDRHKG